MNRRSPASGTAKRPCPRAVPVARSSASTSSGIMMCATSAPSRPWFRAICRAGAPPQTRAATRRNRRRVVSAAGGEPRSEAGERHGQQQKPGQGAVRVAAAGKAKDPQEESEGVAVARQSGAQPDPPTGGVVPDVRDLRGERNQRPAGDGFGAEKSGEPNQRGRRRQEHSEQGAAAHPAAFGGGQCGEIVRGVTARLFGQRIGPGGVLGRIVGAQGFNEGTPVGPDLAPRGLESFDDRAADLPRPCRLAASADHGTGPAQCHERRDELGESVAGVLDGNAQDELEKAPEQRSRRVQRHLPPARRA